MEVTTPIARPTLSSRWPLLDMGLEIPNVPSAFGRDAWAVRETGLTQRFAHGPATAAVARGVDIGFGDVADIGAAAEETSEMSFLIAPRRDFNGAFEVRVGIENARGFEGVHDAKRPIEPARVVLAFEMRPGQQPGSGLRTGAQHIADAVDRSGQPGLGQPLHQPLQRAQMRLGEGRLVNSGFVGADATQRSEIRKDPGAIGLKAMVRHDLF